MFQELSETRFREAFNRKLTPPAPPSPPPQARRDRIKAPGQIQTKTFSFSWNPDEIEKKLKCDLQKPLLFFRET
jgi:hypothetical protein